MVADRWRPEWEGLIRDRFLSTPNRAQFRLIAGEVRHELGLPGPEEIPITAAEEEIIWSLRGGIIYLGIREYVFGLTLADDREALIRWQVEVFVRGVDKSIRWVIGLAGPVASAHPSAKETPPHSVPAVLGWRRSS